MTENKKPIAIIPARGGSKRILKKNTKFFSGKPIIEYSIEAALKCDLFQKVIISTDSDEIASIAEKAGAEIPFMRPPELSDDLTTTAPVLVHAVKEMNKKGVDFPYFCCIYATAPFILPKYLIEGFELLKEKNLGSVFPITSYPFPIFRAHKIQEDGTLVMFWPEHMNTRSNTLPQAYHDAGQFYWYNTEKFLKEPVLYSKDAQGIVLPRFMVQDIDTPEDWETAEKLFQVLNN
ncbi:MAG: pseudaminic acid cytidylyltransferase [Alphaproteobacteria bacterium]